MGYIYLLEKALCSGLGSGVGAGRCDEADIVVHGNDFPHQEEIFLHDVVTLVYNCVSSSDSVALVCCFSTTLMEKADEN